MSFGSTLVYVGIAVTINALWVIVLTPLLILLGTLGIVVPEERYLEQKFGDLYHDYQSRVRRWL